VYNSGEVLQKKVRRLCCCWWRVVVGGCEKKSNCGKEADEKKTKFLVSLPSLYFTQISLLLLLLLPFFLLNSKILPKFLLPLHLFIQIISKSQNPRFVVVNSFGGGGGCGDKNMCVTKFGA